MKTFKGTIGKTTLLLIATLCLMALAASTLVYSIGVDELKTLRDEHTYSAASKILIDFNTYEQRITEEVFFRGDEAIKVYPLADEEAAAEPERDDTGMILYNITKEMMDLESWDVILNPSADTVANRSNSKVVQIDENSASFFECDTIDQNFYEALSTADKVTPVFTKYGLTVSCAAGQAGDGANAGNVYRVLGARIHFPTHNYNAWAKIAPPFSIKVYDENGTLVNLENGVVNNVGNLQWLKLTIAGRNFNNSASVLLLDENGIPHEYFMGSLYYTGWRTLKWSNPNYINELGDRDLYRVPLYPYEMPYLVFDSIIIYRNGTARGGDFVTYVKRVEVQYDLAVPEEQMEEFEDELIWNILAQDAQEAADRDQGKFVDYIELIEQEKGRMGPRAPQDEAAGGNNNAQPAPARGGNAGTN